MRFKVIEARTNKDIFVAGINLKSTLTSTAQSGVLMDYDTDLDLLIVRNGKAVALVPEANIVAVIPHPQDLAMIFPIQMAPAPVVAPQTPAPQVPEVDLSAPIPAAPENYPDEKPRAKPKTK